MIQSHDHQKKPTFGQLIGRFVQKNRIVILVIAIIILVLPLAYIIMTQIEQKGKYDAKIKLYELEDEYNNYYSAKTGDDAEKTKKAEEYLFKFIEDTINNFKGHYAEFRSHEIRAKINLEKITLPENLEKAEKLKAVISDYAEIIKKAPQLAFTPKIILKLCTIIEGLPQMAEKEEALKIELSVKDVKELLPAQFAEVEGAQAATYTDIAFALYLYSSEQQPKSPFILETLINIARIYEEKSMNEKAIEIYEKLENDFANNDWTNIAIDRRIILQAKE